MPALSFSEVRFVRAILEGRKTQSIRPLFCNLCPKKIIKNGVHWGTEVTYKHGKHKPRLKKGDIVKCYFKQRSTPKDSWFCLECGKIAELEELENLDETWICPDHKLIGGAFPKHFATVKITDVFEIEMGKKKVIIYGTGEKVEYWDWNRTDLYNCYVKFSDKYINFPKKDGFKDAKEMFNWFHKKHDLSEPRKFAVYKFEVIGGSKTAEGSETAS
jgi:hypothetical protein